MGYSCWRPGRLFLVLVGASLLLLDWRQYVGRRCSFFPAPKRGPSCVRWATKAAVDALGLPDKACRARLAQEWAARPTGNSGLVYRTFWESPREHILPGRVLVALETFCYLNPGVPIRVHSSDLPTTALAHLASACDIAVVYTDARELLTPDMPGYKWLHHFYDKVAKTIDAENHAVHLADFNRIFLLYYYGGIYFDVDYFFTQPLARFWSGSSELLTKNCCDQAAPGPDGVCPGDCRPEQKHYSIFANESLTGEGFYIGNGMVAGPQGSLFLAETLKQFDDVRQYRADVWTCIGLRTLTRVFRRLHDVLQSERYEIPLLSGQFLHVSTGNPVHITTQRTDEEYRIVAARHLAFHGDLWLPIDPLSFVGRAALAACFKCSCVPFLLTTTFNYTQLASSTPLCV